MGSVSSYQMLKRCAVAGLAFVLACDDTPSLTKLPEPAVQIDELKQKPAALVDILWVVDNSGSMADKQAAVAANFDKFITGLTTCQGSAMANDLCDFNSKKCTVSGAPCNPPDYHIGVTTTDVFSAVDQGRLRKVGLCVPRAGAPAMNNKLRYCQGDNRQCAVDPMDPDSDPANGFCDSAHAINFVTPTTPGGKSAFVHAVKVGITGSGLEEGMHGAALALGREADKMHPGTFKAVPPENAGFLRDDASLFVIFVSDEEDHSFGQVSYFYRAFESLKGAGNEELISISAIVGDPDPDGDAGPMTGGCMTTMMQSAAPGTRYVSLALYSRGLASEFRSCDGKRLLCPSGETCQMPVPNLPGLCVRADACQSDQDCGNFKCGATGCITCDNTKCSAHPDNYIQLLAKNGVFGSICQPDYGEVLGALGFEAAGLKRKFALTKFPDCSQEKIDCAGTPAYMCVKVNGAVIPNDRATGWTYEPGSNAIFFDGSFVPPTDAPIEASYRVSVAGMQISCQLLVK